MDKNPNISRAIELLGGAVAAARVLDVRNYQTVQQWAKVGNVPAKYCLAIQERTGVSVAALRPDDHHLIWAKLLPGSPGPVAGGSPSATEVA